MKVQITITARHYRAAYALATDFASPEQADEVAIAMLECCARELACFEGAEAAAAVAGGLREEWCAVSVEFRGWRPEEGWKNGSSLRLAGRMDYEVEMHLRMSDTG